MPDMTQDQFQAALKKYEKGKAKKAAAEAAKNPDLKPETFKVLGALPFEPIYKEAPKKAKPQEQERPAPKAMKISVSGPIEFSFSIEWAGTLLGGQMNEQALKTLFAKYLSPMGRVNTK